MVDFVVIGGGIVGLSTAWQLQQRHRDKKILLLEKELRLASHQTGHNSGVIHAGIYYTPGSLKADFCKRGHQKTIEFCQQHGIAFEQCGKLLVATNPTEHTRMEALFERAHSNGLQVEQLDSQQLQSLEPNIVGTGAILLNDTGIVDYQQVCEKIADNFRNLGGEIQLNTTVTGLVESDEGVMVESTSGNYRTQFLVSCAGLQADRLCRLLGIETDFQIIPFRGEYYQLPATHNTLVKHLIYPIPDPELPFLGVHITRMIDGSVTVGPNAVQGWKREGYGRINISLRDIWDMVCFPGFWRVAVANIKTGLTETWNSLWKPGYLNLVQKYCPSITLSDLRPYPAGIRAQAVMRDGSLVHDFLFAESAHSLHVCNAPSPAATSALPIGEYICNLIDEKQSPKRDTSND